MFPFEVIETADLSSRELNSLMLRCQEKCVWEERGGGGGDGERKCFSRRLSTGIRVGVPGWKERVSN